MNRFAKTKTEIIEIVLLKSKENTRKRRCSPLKIYFLFKNVAAASERKPTKNKKNQFSKQIGIRSLDLLGANASRIML